MSISVDLTPAAILAILRVSLKALDPATVTFADINTAIAQAQELMP